ncbi:MAG: hypothetical protein WCI03_02835 [bacterium]|jgi:hypothetical protein
MKTIVSRGVGFALLVMTWSAVAGELTVDGSMVVKTNLVVNGQLSSSTLALTNLAISGEATIQRAVILHLAPQGDLGMGPYTNGVGGR